MILCDFRGTCDPVACRRAFPVSRPGGAWSRTVSAITQLSPPDAPWLSDVAADGPNAIVVTWRTTPSTGWDWRLVPRPPGSPSITRVPASSPSGSSTPYRAHLGGVARPLTAAA